MVVDHAEHARGLRSTQVEMPGLISLCPMLITRMLGDRLPTLRQRWVDILFAAKLPQPTAQIIVGTPSATLVQH